MHRADRRARRVRGLSTATTAERSTSSPSGLEEGDWPTRSRLSPPLPCRRRARHRRRRHLPPACRPAARRPPTPLGGAGRARSAAAALPGTVPPRRPGRLACRSRRCDLLTFRRADDEGVSAVLDGAGSRRAARSTTVDFEEDVKFRGLHPMIARRLQMWRLSNFEIRPPAGAGRGAPVRLRRRGQPVRRTARRRGRGARHHPGPRRARPGRGAPGGRERAGRLPRRAPRARWPIDRSAAGSSGTGSRSTSGRRSSCRSTSSTMSPVDWRR